MIIVKDPDIDPETFILKNKFNIGDQALLTQKESDLAIIGIKKLLEEKDYDINVEYLKHINRIMFEDIYYFAGTFRTIEVFKNEEKLVGDSVTYAKPEDIEKNLNDIFEDIRACDFESLDIEGQVNFLCNILTRIWQTHPFREGNTRATLIFLRKYLEKYNLKYDPDKFSNVDTYRYMRLSLVAACYEGNGHERDYSYLDRIMTDIVSDAHKRRLTM